MTKRRQKYRLEQIQRKLEFHANVRDSIQKLEQTRDNLMEFFKCYPEYNKCNISNLSKDEQILFDNRLKDFFK